MNETEIADTIQPVSVGHAKSLFRWGLAISTIYILGLLIYAACVWKPMLKMTPDQFATFLSGVFAPLAFLWLVLGFRQQGDELQNSARALWLQGEELRNSVEQQRQLVDVSREQLASERDSKIRAEEEAERSAQPRLVMSSGGGMYSGSSCKLSLRLNSAGPVCSNVKVLTNGIVNYRNSILRENGSISLTMVYDRLGDVIPIDVLVEYTDMRGFGMFQKFHVPVLENGGPNARPSLGEPILLGQPEKLENISN